MNIETSASLIPLFLFIVLLGDEVLNPPQSMADIQDLLTSAGEGLINELQTRFGQWA